MIDPQILRVRLSKLEAAKDELLTGKAVVSITDGGKAMTFSRAKLSDLNAEIMGLKSALGLARRRAIGVSFGR
ncbi:phage tail protein [Azospirillum cavernae]|uniref:Phage tail protein n=1 Tax=Azospirillum cavernae TaxID=2320860 RepID=A0A418VVH4_9PROT|nr:gpW family head-tail joining protein [Azospirillum cavernae]RJF81119.1 phage tail protein [Azospirillum cavernae]